MKEAPRLLVLKIEKKHTQQYKHKCNTADSKPRALYSMPWATMPAGGKSTKLALQSAQSTILILILILKSHYRVCPNLIPRQGCAAPVFRNKSHFNCFRDKSHFNCFSRWAIDAFSMRAIVGPFVLKPMEDITIVYSVHWRRDLRSWRSWRGKRQKEGK